MERGREVAFSCADSGGQSAQVKASANSDGIGTDLGGGCMGELGAWFVLHTCPRASVSPMASGPICVRCRGLRVCAVMVVN